MGWGELALAAVVLTAIFYVWFVNRRRQRYVGETTFEAPIEAVWRLHDVRPGQTSWVPQLLACEWVDEAARDMNLRYATGAEMRYRVLESQAPHHIVAESRARNGADAPFGDLVRSRVRLTALAGGRTQMWTEMEIERGPPASTFAMRLGYPWVIPWSFRLMRQALVREGASPAAGARSRSVTLAWQVAMVAATIAWLSWLLGVWAGLGALAMLVVHEYGHVWAMRRHGHETARFYLVPFFGGVAIGTRTFATEAESVEIFLMGPVFGLVPSVASLALFGATGDPFWASLAGFLAICNGLNLAPIPPLDGGRIVLSLLRPIGAKAWYAAAGLLVLAGGAIAAYFRLAGLMFVAILGAWAWAVARGPNPATRPMSAGGLAFASLSYASLIALHAGLIVWAFWLDGPGGALEAGPAFARSGID